MDMIAQLVELAKYNKWANLRLLDVYEGLSPSERTTELNSSFPTIRKTVNHIIWVEMLFLRRWKALSTEDMNAPIIIEDTELRRRWSELESEKETFIKTLDMEILDRIMDYKNIQGEPISLRLWQLMFQGINHSTFHRGQVVTMFRLLGKTPPLTDFIIFCRDL
jgi:uncharacterized damage-inducible protein DinB